MHVMWNILQQTCQRLLHPLLVGGSFQQASDGHNHMLKAGPAAGILTPALLQSSVIFNH